MPGVNDRKSPKCTCASIAKGIPRKNERVVRSISKVKACIFNLLELCIRLYIFVATRTSNCNVLFFFRLLKGPSDLGGEYFDTRTVIARDVPLCRIRNRARKY